MIDEQRTEDRKEYQKRYYQEHKETIKARTKKRYKTHIEEIAEYKKVYRQTHKEEIAERQKKYKETHKEDIVISSKLYYDSHKDELKAYYLANKEKIRIQKKARYDSLKDEHKAYYQVNKEKINSRAMVRYNKTHPNAVKRDTEEYKMKVSARLQGIELKDWNGYTNPNPYCDKFNDECRNRNREKYDNQCFICGKTKEENSNRALSVHHVSRNKMEGCDGSKWRLIPLCGSCHGKAHFEPLESRINFLLND